MTLIALIAVLTVTVIQLIHAHGGADATTIGLLVIAICLAFAVMAPSQTGRFVKQVTNFKFAGFEIGLTKVTEAERVKPPGHEGDGPRVKRRAEDLEAVAEHMKSKLRFVRLITGLDREVKEEDNYFEIAWKLRGEQLLEDNEAHFIFHLLNQRNLAEVVLPSAAQEEFLDAAWSFAVRFGATVWDRYVRNGMRSQGWFIADFEQSKEHRRDFLAYRNDFWIVAAARVGGVSEPYYYGPTRKRLAGLELGVPIAGRCVVIPAGDRQATVIDRKGEGAEDGVKVLEFQGSLEAYPPRALAQNDFNEDPRLGNVVPPKS